MKARPQSLALEPLEDRTLLATCTVTNLLDVGRGGLSIGSGQVAGDLHFCINQANALPGPDVLAIAVTGVIKLSGPLPVLASDMEIRGPGTDSLFVRRDTAPSYRIFNVAPGSNVQILRLTVLGGLDSSGGGIFNEGNLTLNQVNVTQNVSIERGGGIFNNGILMVQRSSITHNIAVDTSNPVGAARGGGVYNDSEGIATIEHSEIGTNTVQPQIAALQSAEGAGIYNKGTLTLNYCTLAENLGFALGGGVVAQGGGIYNNQSASLFVSNSSFARNQAVIRASSSSNSYASGGAIFNGGTATIDNSTITENTSAEVGTSSGPYLMSGAGIHNTASMTLANSTVARNTTVGNTGYQAGGGIFAAFPVTIGNSIVAPNSADTEGPNVWGMLDSAGFNLFGDPSGGTGYDESDLLNVDPLLGPLADNGGPTMTIALLPGSPAIDAGDNSEAPEFDQRGPGFPRIVNGTIDIGAFEVQLTGAPSQSNMLAFLVTADLEQDD